MVCHKEAYAHTHTHTHARAKVGSFVVTRSICALKILFFTEVPLTLNSVQREAEMLFRQ
jgi:hypothetical protein